MLKGLQTNERDNVPNVSHLNQANAVSIGQNYLIKYQYLVLRFNLITYKRLFIEVFEDSRSKLMEEIFKK